MKKFLILFPENWTYDTLQNLRDAFYPKLESNEHFKNSVSKWLQKEVITNLLFLSPAGNYMFKVDNRNTKTKCLYCWLCIYFTPYCSISIANFEQVNVSWVWGEFYLLSDAY